MVLSALNRNAMFFTAALPLKILPPFFNRYSGDSNYYGYHTDNAMRAMPDGSGYVRADVSATLFFRAGRIRRRAATIEDTFRAHGPSSAGSMVVYPSSSIHQVSPLVTLASGLACFMFMQSMVRDPGQRRTPFDMDMALLQLRTTIRRNRPVVRPPALINNLLRRWADS